MDSNNCNQHKGTNDVYKGAKKQAVIVDTKDPENAGRVKVRVSGVHPSDLPLDELPWMTVAPELGTNMGQGIKRILQEGMFCEVESLTHSGAEWMITNGSRLIRKELNAGKNESPDEDGAPFSDVFNGDLIKEFIPRIASTMMSKIMTTIYGYITRNLLNLGEDDVELSDPPIKTEDLFLTATPVDFSLDPVPYLTGKNLGMFNNAFWYWRDEEMDDGEMGNSMEGEEMPMPGRESNTGDMEDSMEDDHNSMPDDVEYPSGSCPPGFCWCPEADGCYRCDMIDLVCAQFRSLNIFDKVMETLYPKNTRTKEQDEIIQKYSEGEEGEGEEGEEGMEEHNPEDDVFSAAFSYTTILELQDYEHVVGRDLEGNPAYIKLEGWNLVIPPKVPYGDDPKGWMEYEIGYMVTDREFPEKTAESTITFVVSGPEFNIEEYESGYEDGDGGDGGDGGGGNNPCLPCRYNTFSKKVLRTRKKLLNLNKLPLKTKRKILKAEKEINGTNSTENLKSVITDDSKGIVGIQCSDNEVMMAEIPEYAFAEFPPESENGQAENKDVQQLPNKMTFEHDGSKDNAYYSIKHPSGSRMEYFHDGRMNIKATDSFQLMSMKNLLINSRNTMEVGVSRRINVHTLRFLLESEEFQVSTEDFVLDTMMFHLTTEDGIMFESDMDFFGDMVIDGGLKINGVNFDTHTHEETGGYTETPYRLTNNNVISNRRFNKKSIFEKKFGRSKNNYKKVIKTN